MGCSLISGSCGLTHALHTDGTTLVLQRTLVGDDKLLRLPGERREALGVVHPAAQQVVGRHGEMKLCPRGQTARSGQVSDTAQIRKQHLFGGVLGLLGQHRTWIMGDS